MVAVWSLIGVPKAAFAALSAEQKRKIRAKVEAGNIGIAKIFYLQAKAKKTRKTKTKAKGKAKTKTSKKRAKRPAKPKPNRKQGTLRRHLGQYTILTPEGREAFGRTMGNFA